MRDALAVAYDHVIHTLQRTAYRRKRLYDTKAVNRKFPVGSCVLRYYPPAAQKKLGSPWVGPQQVVRQATGHTVGIQKGPNTPIFIHVDDLKLCPTLENACRTPGPSSAKSLCASTVAFRPGSIVTNSESTHSVIVSTCDNTSDAPTHLTHQHIRLVDANWTTPMTSRIISCHHFSWGNCIMRDVNSIQSHISCVFAMPCYMDSVFLLPVYGSGPDTSPNSSLVVSRPLAGRQRVTLCWLRYTVSVIRPWAQHLLTQDPCPSVYNAQRVGGIVWCNNRHFALRYDQRCSDWHMCTTKRGNSRISGMACAWIYAGGLRNARRWLAAALMWLHIAGAHMVFRYLLLGTVCRTPLHDILLSIPVIDLLLISDYHRMRLLSTYTYRKPLRTYDLTTQLFQKA